MNEKKTMTINTQIRSREAVRSRGEVFTAPREVNAMLDLVAETLPTEDTPEDVARPFLEPACGNGNFLVEILRRKLQHLHRVGDTKQRQTLALLALGSVYGVDIDRRNVEESRSRMVGVLRDAMGPQPGWLYKAAEQVVTGNIVLANFLESDNLAWVRYYSGAPGFVEREWSFTNDERVLRADEEPVPIQRLAEFPLPVLFGDL